MPNRFQRTDRQPVAAAASATPPPGMAALLDSIDGEERALQREQDLPGSTRGAELFAQVLGDLSTDLAVDPPTARKMPKHRREAPRPLTAAGDLVIVFGLPGDAVAVARSMASAFGGADVAAAGATDLAGATRVDDRRTAVRARALGVLNSSPVYVAFGLDLAGIDWSAWERCASALSPDQVWIAADASRKPDDTAHWVNQVAARIPVHALAVEGVALTSTPHTVEDLDLPIGWISGAATPSGQSLASIWDS